MSDLPDLKIRALVNFPSNVNGGAGIDVRNEHGRYFIDLDYADLAPITTVPDAAEPGTYLALWEEAQGDYRRISFTDFKSDIGGGRTPSDLAPLVDGLTASAGTSQDYSRGDHVHPTLLPSVKNFGAKGDAINISTDVTIGAGSANLITSGAATAFTIADIGKVIVVPGAGAAGAALKTIIAGVATSTSITLGTPAVTAVGTVTKLLMYGTDDRNAIHAAHFAAVAAGRALIWTAGNYLTSDALFFGNSNTRHVNLGNVTISFAGAGTGISFDGGVSSGNLFDISFGSRANPFKVVGNPAASILVLCRAVHHSDINVIGRECTSTALNVNFAVCSRFFAKCSTNDGGAFFTKPNAGVILGFRGAADWLTDCDFEIIAEGISGTGIQMAGVQGCRFIGTSEGNVSGGGGIYEGPSCSRNIYTSFHCEANAGKDWTFDTSSDTILINCAGDLQFNNSGRILILGGVYHSVAWTPAANHVHFEGAIIYTSLAGAPATFTWIRCLDSAAVFIPDRATRPTIVAPTLLNSWVNLGGSSRVAGYLQSSDGMVFLCGTIKSGTVSSPAFTLPAGMRPGGTVYFTAFNPFLGTPSFMIQISSNGDVTPQSGVNSGCSLDGISFLAEL